MFRKLLRLFAWVAAIFAALLGFSYFQSRKTPKYIDIYSDIDEDEGENEVY